MPNNLLAFAEVLAYVLACLAFGGVLGVFLFGVAKIVSSIVIWLGWD